MRDSSRRTPSILLVLLLLVTACGDAESPRADSSGAEISARSDGTEEADRRALAALARAGGDLDVPTNIRWTVSFESRRAAEAYAALAREEGWTVERRPSSGESSDLCLCTRRAVPTLETVRAMRAELLQAGLGLSPRVDGWEVSVPPAD